MLIQRLNTSVEGVAIFSAEVTGVVRFSGVLCQRFFVKKVMFGEGSVLFVKLSKAQCTTLKVTEVRLDE